MESTTLYDKQKYENTFPEHHMSKNQSFPQHIELEIVELVI